MDAFLAFLRHAPLPLMALLLFLENVGIFFASLAAGKYLARRFANRAVAEAAPPLRAEEIVLATSTVILNSLVTLAGLLLWRSGIIQFRRETGFAAAVDFLFLVFVMDVCMYVLHRIAHLPLFFRVHRTHHHYDNPRPLTLFVMNPLECLSFGLLWLLVVLVYDATWLGMSLYLAFNVAFGLLGHIGVEPMPDFWKKTPLLRHLSTSSFHAGHHQAEGYNFGFYTLIWDRLFGTLAPRYESDFAKRPT